MKYHRLDARPILRDSIPAHFLSEVDEYTDKDIIKLQRLTLNSDTSLWVSTQNRKIAVRSGYHLLSALRFDNPSIQMEILACTTYHDVRETVQKHAKDERKDLGEKIDELAKYVFSMLVSYNYQSCKDLLISVGKSKHLLVYHSVSGKRSIGVDFVSDKMNVASGANKFGSILKQLAVELSDNPEKLLTVLPPSDTFLLGSPIRMYKRRLSSSDDEIQPNHRELMNITMRVAVRSVSKSEQFLDS